ncbi:hypothetical protein CICLE_v10010316mg, partial [Citrus x clementina]
YLFPILGENTTPFADDIEGILGSIGADCEDKRLELLLLEGNGKDKTELFASRRGKLARMSSNGGAKAAQAIVETKKEEKVEDKEQSNDNIGFGLFDSRVTMLP